MTLRCLGREGSLLEAELELRIPVGDMEDIEEIARDEVPKNPYRVPGTVAVSEGNISAVSETVAEEIVEANEIVEADVVMASEGEVVGETDMFGTVTEVAAKNADDTDGIHARGTGISGKVEVVIPGMETMNVGMEVTDETQMITFVDEPMVVRDGVLRSAAMSDENGLVQDDVHKHKEQAKLPSNKADYMRMSVAEKVRCYPFDTRGTELAFEMVKSYFETVGLSTDFSSVYEEVKLLTECYEKQKVEEFIQERTEQVIEKMDMLGIDTGKITEYSTDVLSVVFGFEDMEYYTGIKLFNRVLDRLGVNMEHQERYEVYDRIYEEGMREEKVECCRDSR